MRISVVVACVLTLAVAGLAQNTTTIKVPQIYTGESYVRDCPEIYPNMPFETVLKVNYCFGYVRGMVDYNSLLNVYPKLNLFCPPRDMDIAQTDATIRKYIKEHPDQREMPITALIAKVLSDAYPCPTQAGSPKK